MRECGLGCGAKDNTYSMWSVCSENNISIERCQIVKDSIVYGRKLDQTSIGATRPGSNPSLLSSNFAKFSLFFRSFELSRIANPCNAYTGKLELGTSPQIIPSDTLTQTRFVQPILLRTSNSNIETVTVTVTDTT